MIFDCRQNGLTSSAGARVTIHSPATRALTDEFGQDIQPATATNFALHAVEHKRLAAPYNSSCFSSWEQTNYTEYTTAWPYTENVGKAFSATNFYF